MTRNSAIDATKIGANMRAAREAKGISRAELARKVNMYPSLIRCYETMEVCPGADKLILLANALGIGLDEYVAGIVTRTPPNKPLTLDELRQMKGLPVWMVTTGLNGPGRWELICDVDYEDVLEMASCVDGFYYIEVNTYGSTWLAYRRPPEGEENN